MQVWTRTLTRMRTRTQTPTLTPTPTPGRVVYLLPQLRWGEVKMMKMQCAVICPQLQLGTHTLHLSGCDSLCITLYCILSGSMLLHCTSVYYFALHCIALHWAMLHWIVLHYIALSYIVLHYITLHCIASCLIRSCLIVSHRNELHYSALHCWLTAVVLVLAICTLRDTITSLCKRQAATIVARELLQRTHCQ